MVPKIVYADISDLVVNGLPQRNVVINDDVVMAQACSKGGCGERRMSILLRGNDVTGIVLERDGDVFKYGSDADLFRPQLP